MKNRSTMFYLTFGLSILIWAGCSEGPAGAPGRDGQDGLSAEITTSPWFSSPGWNWDNTEKVWYFDKVNSAITKDIVENGIVLAYVNLKGDVINDYTVRPLPAFGVNANWDFLLPNDGNTGYGTIEFTSTLSTNPGNVDFFRYVLIPSNYILASAKLKSTSITDIRKMPYSEVCKLLNISE